MADPEPFVSAAAIPPYAPVDLKSVSEIEPLRRDREGGTDRSSERCARAGHQPQQIPNPRSSTRTVPAMNQRPSRQKEQKDRRRAPNRSSR